MTLYDEVLKLAHAVPSTRRYLVPLLRKASVDKIALKHRTFQRLMAQGGSFGVISAYASGPKSKNKERHGELVADLQRLGYRRFSVLKGSWEGVAERSIIIPDIKPEHLFELGRKYGQDSVIYKI